MVLPSLKKSMCLFALMYYLNVYAASVLPIPPPVQALSTGVPPGCHNHSCFPEIVDGLLVDLLPVEQLLVLGSTSRACAHGR